MADSLKTSFDSAQWDALLGKLTSEARESLARRMLVSGGVVLRDEARARAPKRNGTLERSIYLAYRDGESTPTSHKYSVTWNAKKAPHGHLLEFGHWRYNLIINGKAQPSLKPGLTKGKGPQDHEGPGALAEPIWVAAEPFLRPAFDAKLTQVKAAMIDRGRAEVQILLRG